MLFILDILRYFCVEKKNSFHSTKCFILLILCFLLGCPWGDRYSDCSGANCQDPKIREYCCETCDRIPQYPVTTTLSPLSPSM